MQRLEFSFTSQEYRGILCQHEAVAFIPEPWNSRRGAAIILGEGIYVRTKVESDWIEPVVLGLEVPCIVVRQGFDAKKFRARNPGELMAFGDKEYFRTGDPRESGYYALAKIISAAATVAEHLPEISAKRFIVTGSSKGGMASLIACAGDQRIVAAFPTAWNAGRMVAATELKGERWGWDVKPKQTGPAGWTATEAYALLSTPRGERYRQLFDPAEWGDKMDGKFVMPTVGTNDHLFHLLADENYYDELTCRKAFLRVPNYGHGRLHGLHAKAWRFSVAAGLLNHPVPSVRLIKEVLGDKVRFEAKVTNVSHSTRLELWKATDELGDYREAEWANVKSIELRKSEASVRIDEIKPPLAGTAAYYVLLTDDVRNSVTSSNVVELGTALLAARE
jgi:PhoPQ-activated pathogenicity-related protein